MANFFEQKDRTVIPNFRSFHRTLELGELDYAKIPKSQDVIHSINPILLNWERQPSIGAAADVLSAAIVSGIKTNPAVIKAAEYIRKHKIFASPSQLDLTNTILNQGKDVESAINLPRLSLFLDRNIVNEVQPKIRNIKAKISRFDKDPILYVELARLYTILGKERLAKKNMNIAIHLDPENRYVVRSFARLNAHYGEEDRAYDIIKKIEIVKNDPWLFSTQLALATLLNKGTRLYKHGYGMINSGKYNEFSLSELTSGLATIDLLEGSRNKSKDLFERALKAPNDNSLAQTEWALTKEHLFDLDLSRFGVQSKYEALAIDTYMKQNWDEAIKYSEEWFMDMPFAKRPVMLGSHIASVILDNQELAQMFCRAGLRTNPKNPGIINNLAYSLALENNVNEAEELIKSLDPTQIQELSTKVCLTATLGLICYRKGDYLQGKDLYLKAIKASEKLNSRYRQLAILNYAREEKLSNHEIEDEITKEIKRMEAKIDSQSFGIKVLYDKVSFMIQDNIKLVR